MNIKPGTYLPNTASPFPKRDVAQTSEEARKIVQKTGFPVVIKAFQVLVGGRGKAGGSRSLLERM